MAQEDVSQRHSTPKSFLDALKTLLYGLRWSDVALLGPILVWLIVNQIPPVLARFQNFVNQVQVWIPVHKKLAALIATGLVFGAGALASSWKRRAQRSYGLGELGFGIAATFIQILNFGKHSGYENVVTAIGSTYLAARGITNVLEAKPDTVPLKPYIPSILRST